MAGYSGTPLVKKLGLKPGLTALSLSAPEHYLALLEPLPPELTWASRLSAKVDFVHGFFTRSAELAEALQRVRTRCGPEVTMWISWPKKAARIPTDITEDTIRELALPMGWVDVKVCAVDDVWSGLKLVVRASLR